MLSRLAVVVWWTAILCFGMAAWAAIPIVRSQLALWDCEPVFAEQLRLEQANQEAIAAVLAKPRVAEPGELNLAAVIEILQLPRAMPKWAGFEADAARCNKNKLGENIPLALLSGMAAVIGVLLLALAYVLGGRFWLPARSLKGSP